MLTHEQLGFLYAGLPADATVLRAQPHGSLTPGKHWLWQTFYPASHALQAQGHTVSHTLADLPLSNHICLIGSRHKDENRGLLATAVTKLNPGGTLTTLLPNDLGAKTLETDLRTLFGNAHVNVTSKHHARKLTATLTPDLNADLQHQWQSTITPARHVDGTFFTCPGIFSWRNIDEGSRLLAEHLPTGLSGTVADLGAGWGYLAHALLTRTPGLQIDLYEAEHLALDCARLNLAAHPQCQYHWCDVTTLKSNPLYNTIITNPPVHNLHDNDVGLGINFVTQALRMLAPKGQLYLVANRHLPYEALLKGYHMQTLAQTGAYKIIHARG